MIIKFLIFIQLAICNLSNGQRYEHIDFNYESFNKRYLISDINTFEEVIIRINELCSSDTQKLCLVAGWIYKNIDFDISKFAAGGNIPAYEEVYSKRKGVCGDYASLFSEFCNQLGIENVIIEGYVEEYNSNTSYFEETNHAWNVVMINDQWYHCDLLGFSGKLKPNENNSFDFVKNPDVDFF